METIRKNKSYTPYISWLLASLFYFFQYILRVLPNIIIEDIMHKFEINTAQFGQFSGIYYIGYSLMHIPIAIMLDRIGSKKVITMSILLSVAGLIPICYSNTWILAVLGRFLTGIGSTGAALSMISIIRLNFDDNKYTRMLSFSLTIGLLGGIYGGGPVNYLCKTLGFIYVSKLFILSGVLLTILSYIFLPKEPKIESKSILSDIKEVMFNKKLLFACLCSGLMVGPLEGFADAWGGEFLKGIYGFTSNEAASLTSFIFVGMCFGCPLLGYIADNTDYYKTTIISGFLMFGIFTTLLFGYLNPKLLLFGFVLTGVCSSYQILVLYMITKFVSNKVSGLATAITNMIVMSFGYGFHSLIGLIVNNNGGLESKSGLLYGTSIIPIGLLLGSLGFVFLNIIRKKSKSI